jgi:uncharacterized protein GlcG (DUF336 family)
MILRHAVLAVALLLTACGGGSQDSPAGTDQTGGSCAGSCATPGSSLTAADVQKVIAQAVGEAQARHANATIAVVDRVGNVLGVFRMGVKADRQVVIATALDGSGRPVVQTGLEGIRLPVPAVPVNIDDQAAIAKAITGAYLSSEGNAFSSRTASQIVQEHFNPGEQFQPGGPLFGVQFSQLACSDFIQKSAGTAAVAGPQRSPLGLSADPGGFPLYKDGTVVGGVGVMADGVYGIDKNITDRDADVDEAIAYAATFGFSAPLDRRGDRITVDGKTLRFSDLDFDSLSAKPESAPAFASISASVGTLIAVNGYSDGTIHAGTVFGQPASGIRADAANFPGQDAFVFVDNANAPRFPPIAASDVAGALTQSEVQQLLRSALDVANRARAQIRRPLGSQARVTISVVDSLGNILGMVRTRDAPVFGADVSLQKARDAALMSSPAVASYLASLPDAKYITTDSTGVHVTGVPVAPYVTALTSFIGQPLNNGQIAFSDRSIGNLSRPFFPDGIDSTQFGPLSKPNGQWSVFSTGLQLDISINAILQHVLFVAGVPVPDVVPGCTGVDLANDLSSVTRVNTDVRLGNGLQIFPGSVPIYRGGTLVGGIGVSGDGIDQDDMIASLGLKNAGATLNTGIGHAPADRRSDTLVPGETRLRYVQCPQAPFLDSDAQNVCEGL